MIAERRANAGEALPREDRVRIVEERSARRERVIGLDASDTDIAADEAPNAVIAADIEKTTIARAASRERVWQFWENAVVAAYLTEQTNTKHRSLLCIQIVH